MNDQGHGASTDAGHKVQLKVVERTQLSSTSSYKQEQLTYPCQVLLQLRPRWTGSKALMSLHKFSLSTEFNHEGMAPSAQRVAGTN